MADKNQLKDLTSLAEAAWMAKSRSFGKLAQRDSDLGRQVENLAKTRNHVEIAQQIMGFDRTSERWRLEQRKKLNLERARLKAQMARIEPELRQAFGRKVVLEKLLTQGKSKP